jgi:hypothetical protein
MSVPFSSYDDVRPEYRVLQLPGFTVTWVGDNPTGAGMAFGSDDGRLLIITPDGKHHGPFVNLSQTDSAVNDVAYSDGVLAISTRNDVNFIEVASIKPGVSPKGFCLPYGAHGISRLPSGKFVAAFGRAGLVFISPKSTPSDPVMQCSGDREGMYVYRAIGAQGLGKEDAVVCAARAGGLGMMAFEEGNAQQVLHTMTFDGFDSVDVCSIGGAGGRAVAALGRDGSITLVKDVLVDRAPMTVRYQSVEGTAYRLLSAQGHLFMLTDRAVHVCANLANKFLAGRLDSGGQAMNMKIPLEAVDIAIVANRFLVVVMTDRVLASEIGDLLSTMPSRWAGTGPREERSLPFTGHWRDSAVPQRASVFATQ